ncbi:hypothetical protein ATB93_06580 [Sphingomonas sp. WG]|nr:hypothetical protein ATB93_06580 [Sphingomonas sp. WG]
MAHHAFGVVQNVRCRVAEDAHALCFQPCVAGGVALRAVAAGMGFAIHFDREMGWGAVEVQHVRTGRVLLAEAQTRFVLAQREPKGDFRRGHFFAQAFGVAAGIIGTSQAHRFPPPPPPAAAPPPGG